MYLFVLKFNIIFFTRPFIALCIFLYASCFSMWCKSFVICISSKNKKIEWEWEREQRLEKNPYKIYCMYIKYFNDLLLLFPFCNAFHCTHTAQYHQVVRGLNNIFRCTLVMAQIFWVFSRLVGTFASECCFQHEYGYENWLSFVHSLFSYASHSISF